MKDINLNEGVSKTFVETVQARVINGFLYMNLQSGAETHSFVLPLPLAKGMGKGIAQQIAEIEQKMGRKFDEGTDGGPILSPWSSPPPKSK